MCVFVMYSEIMAYSGYKQVCTIYCTDFYKMNKDVIHN